MNKNKITFADIAKYTNFSKTTISRYFNNPDSLTLENQEIIAKALVDLDYRENKLAKVFANGKSEFVGIIVPNLYLHYYAEMLNQILNTYEKFVYKFLVFVSNNNEETDRKYIRELLASKIECMIILSHTSVNTDNYLGAVQGTTLLFKNKCDVLLHINSMVSKDVPAYGRIQGFQDICRKHNIKYELIIKELEHSQQEINQCMLEVYEYVKKKYPNQKKGLFLSNDTYANSMLNIIFREYGTLPDEYRIIGFDDSPIAIQAIMPISTVAQQIDKLAYEAMEILVIQMNERKKRCPKPQTELIHKNIIPILIRRKTTD